MQADVQFDHVAMPVGDIERSVEFYQRVLGARPVGLEEWRAGKRHHVSVHFGGQKFNFHPPDNRITLKAAHPRIGGGDYCFVWPGTSRSAIDHLNRLGIPIVAGPGKRDGGRGPGVSVYFRDPDGNLLELMSYDPEDVGESS